MVDFADVCGRDQGFVQNRRQVDDSVRGKERDHVGAGSLFDLALVNHIFLVATTFL